MEPLVDDDASLLGIPWGRVNYHPDRCQNESSHAHVVWQEGSDLKRATEFRPQRYVRVWPEAGPSWLRVAALEGEVTQRPMEFPRDEWPTFTVRDTRCAIDVPDDVEKLWTWWGSSNDIPRDVVRQSLAETFPGRAVPTAAELRADVEAELEAARILLERRRERWAEIQALPQLFIAV